MSKMDALKSLKHKKAQEFTRVHALSAIYGTTEKKFEVEKIIDVFGKKARRMFKVQWRKHPGKDSWQHENSLLEDGCKESIDDYWTSSKSNPALDFHPDKQHPHRC